MNDTDDTRPNVLIFMTDQQNARTVLDGSGARAITPNLDRFRARAVSFANAFSPSPHCCPSRASFFSGQYPSEHGVWNNVNVTNALSRGPRPDTPFWSRDFVKAGYRMAFAGKWHVSNSENPSDFGWRELLVTGRGGGAGLSAEAQRLAARRWELKAFDQVDPHFRASPRRAGEIVRPGWPRYTHYGTSDDPFSDRAVTAAGEAFLRDDAPDGDAPWCLYVGTLGPHDPYFAPQRFLDWYDPDSIVLPENFHDSLADKPNLYSRTRERFDQLTEAEHREALRHYLAFCSYEDALFGTLMTVLEETGQADNTIVLYLSDHGDYLGEHGLWGKGLPAFRGAYNVPFVIGGPGILARGDCNQPLSLADAGPTLAALCGVPLAGNLSGQSLAPVLKGGAADARDIFFQSNGNEAYGIQRVIVSDRWKLVHNMFDHDELYDLKDDPGETKNLLAPGGEERRVGRGPLDMVPADLRDTVENLYGRLWSFGIDHDDSNFNNYIMTALAPFGPAVARKAGRTETSDAAGRTLNVTD